jgi:hypothetical protein
MSGKEQGLREIIIIFGALVIAALGIAAGKYYSDRRRYFRQSGQFARRNGLAIEEVSVAGLDIELSGRLKGRSIKTSAGLDVALSGRLEGRSIKTSIVQMSVDEDKTEEGVSPDVYGYYFETYHIEVDIDKNQQWLVLMNFEYQGSREKLQSPEMPLYGRKFGTASKEFDRRYFLFAESKPSHHLFGNPLLLRELMDRKLRAAHANGRTLHVYFDRPMLWKYSSFQKVENLIRLAMKIAS